MLGGFSTVVALVDAGVTAVDSRKIKLKLRQSKYLNFNNLLKIFVIAPQSQNI